MRTYDDTFSKVAVPPAPPAPPSDESFLLREVIAELARLRDGIGSLATREIPAPEVHVPAPDFDLLINAIAGMRPGVTAAEIATELSDRIVPPGDDSEHLIRLLNKIAEGMERQGNLMTGIARSSGGGVSSTALTDGQLRATPVPVSGTITSTIGLTDAQLRASAVPVTVSGGSTSAKQDDALAVLRDIKRAVNDYRTLLDYDARTDGNPVYVGTNAQAAAQGDATWTVTRLTYDASSRLTDKQVIVGTWTGRAGLAWV